MLLRLLELRDESCGSSRSTSKVPTLHRGRGVVLEDLPKFCSPRRRVWTGAKYTTHHKQSSLVRPIVARWLRGAFQIFKRQ